jgi:hypothetical protein
MKKIIQLSIAFVFGIIWSTISGAYIYLAISLFLGALYILLPFVFPLFNILISFLLLIVVLAIYFLIYYNFIPSAVYIYHLILYIFIVMTLIYITEINV